MLRDVVAGLDPADLEKRSERRRWRHEEMIAGIAAHDLYHAGQIQLLKRLHVAHASRRRPRRRRPRRGKKQR